MDELIARQDVLLKVARDKQSMTYFHAVVEYNPSIKEYPINSYVLYTPPVGSQVMDKTHSIYTIEDLVNGKRINTHIHNLRRTMPLVVAQT